MLPPVHVCLASRVLPACRQRFVPVGARQGPNTRGRAFPVPSDATSYQHCNADVALSEGSPGSNWQWWSSDGSGVNIEPYTLCTYNTYMDPLYGVSELGFMTDGWMYNTDNSPRQAGSPFRGTTWLYTHANDCHRMSRDMRLSMFRTPQGLTPETTNEYWPEADKCTSRVGTGPYVAVDDLWGFMASEEHDPCGWPFVECVADCSLPSLPSTRGWAVNATDGLVYDGPVPVGCLNPATCTDAVGHASEYAQLMRDPRTANHIGAM